MYLPRLTGFEFSITGKIWIFNHPRWVRRVKTSSTLITNFIIWVASSFDPYSTRPRRSSAQIRKVGSPYPARKRYSSLSWEVCQETRVSSSLLQTRIPTVSLTSSAQLHPLRNSSSLNSTSRQSRSFIRRFNSLGSAAGRFNPLRASERKMGHQCHGRSSPLHPSSQPRGRNVHCSHGALDPQILYRATIYSRTFKEYDRIKNYLIDKHPLVFIYSFSD